MEETVMFLKTPKADTSTKKLDKLAALTEIMSDVAQCYGHLTGEMGSIWNNEVVSLESKKRYEEMLSEKCFELRLIQKPMNPDMWRRKFLSRWKTIALNNLYERNRPGAIRSEESEWEKILLDVLNPKRKSRSMTDELLLRRCSESPVTASANPLFNGFSFDDSNLEGSSSISGVRAECDRIIKEEQLSTQDEIFIPPQAEKRRAESPSLEHKIRVEYYKKMRIDNAKSALELMINANKNGVKIPDNFIKEYF